MAAIAPRTTDPDLTTSTSAGCGAVHGVAGPAVGERIRVVDEDSAAPEADVLAAHPDGSTKLWVHRNRGTQPAQPPMSVTDRACRHSTTRNS